MEKPNNIVRIPCTLEDNFFELWFVFLKPFHNLTNKEIKLISELVKHRYHLSKVIKDPDILDQVTLGEETRRKVRESCGLTPAHFHLLFSSLKKNKMIVDNKINPKFIPNITTENGYFQLTLLFDMK